MDRESILRDSGYVTTDEMMKLSGCKDSRGGQLERKWLNVYGLHPLCIPLRGSSKRFAWYWHKSESQKLSPTAAQMALPVAATGSSGSDTHGKPDEMQRMNARIDELVKAIQSLAR